MASALATRRLRKERAPPPAYMYVRARTAVTHSCSKKWSANELVQDAFIDVCSDKDEAQRCGFHRPEHPMPFASRWFV